MKRRGMVVDDSTKIVFGGNVRWVWQIFCLLNWRFILIFSGLIAGTVWGKTWPEHQNNIIVGSSLYDASVKVIIIDNIFVMPKKTRPILLLNER